MCMEELPHSNNSSPDDRPLRGIRVPFAAFFPFRHQCEKKLTNICMNRATLCLHFQGVEVAPFGDDGLGKGGRRWSDR